MSYMVVQREFCPPLDSALVHALLLDLPSSTPSLDELEAIRTTLIPLASDAELQARYDDDRPARNSLAVIERNGSGDGEAGASPTTTNESLGKALEVWSLNDSSSQSTTTTNNTSNHNGDDDHEYRPDDPLAFLSSVFPDRTIESLQIRLEAALGDLEVVVDELLSSDLLRDAQEEEHSTEAGRPSSLTEPPLSKQQRKRLKAAQKASSTLSLTSTPHLTPSSTVQLMEATNSTPIASARPTENRWASISSHASNLATLLHITEGRVTSTYHASSSSLPLTMARLLHTLSSERPFTSLPTPLDSRDQLAVVLPRLPTDRLEMLLSATEGDLSDAMDLERTIREIERTEGRMVWSEIVPLDSSEPSFGSLPHPRYPQTTTTTLPLLPSLPPTTHARPDRYSSAECAAYELEYQDKRNVALRSAARHFQKGGLGERGAAYYWAEEGRKMDAKRRIWSERRAIALVKERGGGGGGEGGGGGRGLDLHGLTISEAIVVVRTSLDEWWARVAGTLSPPPLRIITGVGRHSANHVAVLLPAVIKLLDREGWKWTYDGVGMTNSKGAVLVRGRK